MRPSMAPPPLRKATDALRRPSRPPLGSLRRLRAEQRRPCAGYRGRRRRHRILELATAVSAQRPARAWEMGQRHAFRLRIQPWRGSLRAAASAPAAAPRRAPRRWRRPARPGAGSRDARRAAASAPGRDPATPKSRPSRRRIGTQQLERYLESEPGCERRPAEPQIVEGRNSVGVVGAARRSTLGAASRPAATRKTTTPSPPPVVGKGRGCAHRPGMPERQLDGRPARCRPGLVTLSSLRCVLPRGRAKHRRRQGADQPDGGPVARAKDSAPSRIAGDGASPAPRGGHGPLYQADGGDDKVEAAPSGTIIGARAVPGEPRGAHRRAPRSGRARARTRRGQVQEAFTTSSISPAPVRQGGSNHVADLAQGPSAMGVRDPPRGNEVHPTVRKLTGQRHGERLHRPLWSCVVGVAGPLPADRRCCR